MVWTDIVLEGYCVCKDKKLCIKRKANENEQAEGQSNPVAKKLVPEFWCHEVACPFFMSCNANEKMYDWISKFYEKKDG